MIKNRLVCYVVLLLFLSIRCSKDNVPNYVGNWDGIDEQIVTANGVLQSEISIPFELELMESGDGSFISSQGNNTEVHWVSDEAEKEIFIIREFESSNGDNIISIVQFEIEKNTGSEQIWKSITSYTNTNTGEIQESLTRWTLVKK